MFLQRSAPVFLRRYMTNHTLLNGGRALAGLNNSARLSTTCEKATRVIRDRSDHCTLSRLSITSLVCGALGLGVCIGASIRSGTSIDTEAPRAEDPTMYDEWMEIKGQHDLFRSLRCGPLVSGKDDDSDQAESLASVPADNVVQNRDRCLRLMKLMEGMHQAFEDRHGVSVERFVGGVGTLYVKPMDGGGQKRVLFVADSGDMVPFVPHQDGGFIRADEIEKAVKGGSLVKINGAALLYRVANRDAVGRQEA